MNNDYVIKENSYDIIKVWPKMKGGSDLTIHCQNIQGCPCNRAQRHKLLEVEKSLNKDITILMETGVMKKDKIWTGNDEVKVFQNNPAQDENKQTLVAGLGTAIFCKKEITLMKG